jgi:hypothetical protein
MDVIVILEIQDFFLIELSAIVGEDRVRDPKMKNDILDEIYGLLGANFSQGSHLNPLSKFDGHDEQVGITPGTFWKGLRRSRPHMMKGQVMGII